MRPPDPSDEVILVEENPQKTVWEECRTIEEVEDDEEQGSIPEDHFEIKTTEGKSRKMKGVTRERMSLMIGKQITSVCNCQDQRRWSI